MDLLELLDEKGIEYQKTNNPAEIKLRCTNPEHVDSTPSMMYNMDKNLFNCWSCGYRGGVTKFLRSIGEEHILELESKQPHKINKLRDKLNKARGIGVVEIPTDAKPFVQDYRAISAKTYKRFGAFYTSELNLIDYLCFPIYQFGKLRFIEGRLLREDLPNQARYSRQPAASKVSDIMFPLDKVENLSHVILVEGLFDMLNLWDLGYENVLCLFGAHSFNREKLDILDTLGVNRVTLMLDPDLAGQRAAEKIERMLDKRNIRCNNILLPEDYDPGNLSIKQAMRLIR